jgi:hypothetical protein
MLAFLLEIRDREIVDSKRGIEYRFEERMSGRVLQPKLGEGGICIDGKMRGDVEI